MTTKKALAIIMTFILSFGVLTVAFADETAEVPEGYTPIYTAEDLYNIRNDLAGKYILMNDIDLSVYENWEPIGTEEAPFTGELDGNGFLIRNMTIVSECSEPENNLGLFGVVQDGFIKHTIVENTNITASSKKGTVNAAVSVGTISGKVIAENDSMRLLKCSAVGKITISGFECVSVGGLAGTGVGAIFIGSSSNYTDINITADGNSKKIFASGILGTPKSENSSYFESLLNIFYTANFGDVFLDNSECDKSVQIYLSGILSYQVSGNKISKCYNTGRISSTNSTGNLIAGGVAGTVVSRLEYSCNFGEINIPADENDKVGSICTIEDWGGLAVGPNMPQDYLAYICYCVESPYPPCYQNSDEAYIFYKKIYTVSKQEIENQDTFTELDFTETWKMAKSKHPVLNNQPQFTVKENVTLKKGESYFIKQSEICTATSGTENISVTTDEKNNIIITAFAEGTAKVIAEYEYGYYSEYTITIMSNTTELPTEPSTESTTEPSTENTTKPSNNECPLANLWIVRAVKWLMNLFWNVITLVIELI